MKKNPQMPSARRILGMVVGIVIIGLGIALFKQSHLGNDSISALNMRLAEMLGISLGVQNLCTNILFFALQFWFGRKYIGLGTFVNGIGVGFIVTAFYDPIAAHFGPAEALGLPVQLLWVNLVTDCFPALALGMEDAEGDIMKRKPRNAKDGVFAGHMGLDCVVQGLIITVLVLASFFVGVYFDMGYIHIADMIAGNADEEGVMMAFITLNMVEIFHCFNMRSRRASLFTMKKQNKWLWASAALALVLTVIVTVQPTLAEMFFGPVTLELKGVLAALGLAFLIIPLMEIYKAIMRAVEKE